MVTIYKRDPMNNEQKKALKKLIEYVEPDECENFNESSEDEKQNHIYKDILILKDFLGLLDI
jgi:hypothetical protein